MREALSRDALREIWPAVLTGHAGLALLLVAGFHSFSAPLAIALIYGPDFGVDTMLALAVGLAAGFRVLRTPYSQLAVWRRGARVDPARANLVRALALVPAAGCAALGLPLAAIAGAAAAGEARGDAAGLPP